MIKNPKKDQRVWFLGHPESDAKNKDIVYEGKILHIYGKCMMIRDTDGHRGYVDNDRIFARKSGAYQSILSALISQKKLLKLRILNIHAKVEKEKRKS
jgi:hypothetical protein